MLFFRCINITKNDIWLDLDQESLRYKISWMTWFAMLANIFSLIPFVFFTEEASARFSMFNVGIIMVLMVLSISFAVAFFFYLKILKFARAEAAEFQAAVLAAAAAAANNAAINNQSAGAAGAVLSSNGNGSSSGNNGGNVNNASIFDDSDDDDLIDPSESPSAKQESAVFVALKTMSLLVIVQIACALSIALFEEGIWKYAFTTTLLAMIRHPGILAVGVFNFGPIRNTVSIYIDNLPDHLSSVFDPVVDLISGLHFATPATDDQRSFVEASHDDNERASPVVSRDTRPNIVGKRDSAVSPANSNDSLSELPAVQC